MFVRIMSMSSIRGIVLYFTLIFVYDPSEKIVYLNTIYSYVL